MDSANLELGFGLDPFVGDESVTRWIDLGIEFSDSATGALTEETRNTYNAQGRLSRVAIDSDGGATFNPDTSIDYGYDDNGFRVLKDDGTAVTHYVADANNHTGFTQVLEERDAAGNIEKTFLIGHDVLAQHDSTNGLVYLVSDGHGSTRQLINVAGAILNANSIAQVFTYTAYGEPLGFDTTQAITSLLYTGEWLDVEVGWHYNRARWYDPETGTWNRIDDFPGNTGDPVSLHKYLYVHGDPVNGIDPSGLLLTSTTTATTTGAGIDAFSIGATILILAKVQQLRDGLENSAEFSRVADQLQTDVVSRVELERRTRDPNGRYFVHGSTTAVWPADATAIQLGQNRPNATFDFGFGFYTFRADAEGIGAAQQQAQTKTRFSGGVPFVLLVRVDNAAWAKYTKQDYGTRANPSPRWSIDVNAFRNGERAFVGKDVAFGPTAKQRGAVWVVNPRLPEQFKFETTVGLQPAGVLPAFTTFLA